MDSEEPFKRGYLFTPPQGKLLKRSWQKKRYYALYQAGTEGIERVEIFDSEAQFSRHASPNKLIPLNDCIKVVQTPQKHQSNVFEVICKNQTHQFSAETTQELAEWIAAFQTVAFGSQRRESHPVIPVSATRDSTQHELEAQEEENMIYSSMTKPEIYTVQVVETEASKRCGLSGSYQIVVTPLHISISPVGSNSSKANKALYTWHYRHIRRFSQNKETFSFEAGRKCASGEGIFMLETKEGNAIFQSVSVYLKTYKKTGSSSVDGKSVTFSTGNCSGTSSTSSNENSKSVKSAPTPPVEESLYENTNAGHLRPPISKPPRKVKTSTKSSSSESHSPSIDVLSSSPPKTTTGGSTTSIELDSVFESEAKQHQSSNELVYDVPEERKDAWKTHGMEEDNVHTENILASDDSGGPLYASVDVTTITSTKIPILKRFMSAPEVLASARETPAFRPISVFTPRCNQSDSYDHLFQFGPQQNLAPDPDHIYKKLSPPPTSRSSTALNAINANSSNQVAGRVEDEEQTPTVKHVLQNNEVYSVVVKKNQVKQ